MIYMKKYGTHVALGYLMSVLALAGCCHTQRSDWFGENEVRKHFEAVLRDAKRAGTLPVDGFYATGYVNFVVPESVQELLALRDTAIGVLEKLAKVHDFNERSLANACLRLLEAERVERFPERTVSEIRLVRYKIPAGVR
jgi:hypothetical protein